MAADLLEDQYITLIRLRALCNAAQDVTEKFNAREVPDYDVLTDLDSLLLMFGEQIERAMEQNQGANRGGVANG